MKQSFYQIIGITTDNEIIMLDYVFKHDDNFKGATGSIFRPVYQDEIDESNSMECLKDNYSYLWVEAVEDHQTTLGLEEYLSNLLESHLNNSDSLFLCHDTSYIQHIPDTFKDEYYQDAETFSCTGGGRIFSKNDSIEWKVLLKPELLSLIYQYEN